MIERWVKPLTEKDRERIAVLLAEMRVGRGKSAPGGVGIRAVGTEKAATQKHVSSV